MTPEEGAVPSQQPAEPEKPEPAPDAAPPPASQGEEGLAAEPVPPPDAELVFMPPPEEEAPAPEVDCDARWGCWDLLYTMPDTVLGVRGSMTYAFDERGDTIAAGFDATYTTEHYATHDYMTVHFAGFGALGPSTEGAEGGVGVSLDFGFRAKVTDTSGPFLRAGFQGLYLGNRALNVGLLEPLQGRAGYQRLKGRALFELGVTQGFVALGRYGVEGRHRDLSRSTEIGGYLALGIPPFRGNLSFSQVLPRGPDGGDGVTISRFSLCSYALEVTLCADLLYTRGQVAGDVAQGLHGGVTIGLSP